jgi:hypothetical protein
MSAVVDKATKPRVTGKMVAAAARKYSGVPIIEGGRSRETGTDCVGLILGVAHDLGLEFPADIEGYGLSFWRHPKESESLAVLRQYMVQTHRNGASTSEVIASAAVGDLLLFEVHGRALSLAIVTETKLRVELYDFIPVRVPISKVVGGLHELGPCFSEYPFDLKFGCAVSACFRFRELA